MTEELHGIVSGRVQGVAYRDYIARHARSLRLVGEVRNLPDGRVEIVAQGEPEALKIFLARAKKGPLFARVSRVDAERRPPSKGYDSFEIVFSAG